MLERLIEALEAERDTKAAIGYGLRLRQLDPCNEEAHRTLMRLHAANQDRAGVLRAYHTCVKTLQDEVGADPSPETRALYELLQKSAAAPLLAAGAAQSQPGFVGRQHEWQMLQAAWRAAIDGKPGCVIITGEAGIGKTRLAEELLTWAGRQGATVAAARCYAAEGALAYAPIVTWLRSPALRQRLLALEPIVGGRGGALAARAACPSGPISRSQGRRLRLLSASGYSRRWREPFSGARSRPGVRTRSC